MTSGEPASRPPSLTLVFVAVAFAASLVLLSASRGALVVGTVAGCAAFTGLVGWSSLPLAGSDWPFDAGVAGLFGAVLFAGGRGVAVRRVLPAAVLVACAWTVGRHGRTLVRQVGPAASTRRVELVHMTATVFAIAVAAVVGTAIARVLAGGSSAFALALLLVGLVAVITGVAEPR